MPIHEFSCAKCGKEFEDLVFGNERPACPHCGSTDTQKLMSACARRPRGGESGDFSMPAGSGGCGSCSGGNCAACGH